jgi:hypothetical protein
MRIAVHPHCRCYLRQRGDLSATHAREDPAAARTFLSRLDPKDAARVAGSRAKRDEMLKGTAPETIWNAKRPEAYRIGTVGDVILRPMSDEQKHAITAARDTLLQAREHPRWPTNNLNRNKRETERMLLALSAHQSTPEVADFIGRVRRNPSQVDSRELHYMQRRYRDGRTFSDLNDFDALFDRVLHDPDAKIYRQRGVRYQVRSPLSGWIAILDQDGARVSLYPDLNDDFGEPLWTLKDLIP